MRIRFWAGGNLPLFAARRPGITCWSILPELVVKAVGESGGYGMLIGPAADRATDRGFPRKIQAEPAKLHCAAGGCAVARSLLRRRARTVGGRHVDLRPYCLYDGEKVTIVPGGLTRVALQEGSLVVNSSQGGGSKDTWVLRGGGANAFAHRGIAVLAGPLHRARRGYGAHSRRELPHAAGAVAEVLPPALGAAVIMAGEEERFRQLYEEANAHKVFEFLAFRQDNQTRSCSASPRRGKTRAPFATAFRAKCGKTSTGCITP